MVAETEIIVCSKSLPVLEVTYFTKETHLLDEIKSVDAGILPIDPNLDRVRASESDMQQIIPDIDDDTANRREFSSLRSGSFADIGPRRNMEDEHIRIDDLCTHLESIFKFPKPSGFYGVFDGHGGPEAAAFIKNNVLRLFFEDVGFPKMAELDEFLPGEMEDFLHKGFLLADQALADDSGVGNSTGTTALTALVLGRLLMVANVGDCRAVLSRNGEAVDMSQDHRPIYSAEKERVEELGGFVDGGYLNGVLSVSRALGDWDMKLPHGSSPLIAEPECRQVILTDMDEFLIIACDGIWDVLSSQQAVDAVRQGLQRHDNPERCARDLVLRALRLDSFDNLTVIIVCFSSFHQDNHPPVPEQQKLRYCSLSAQALCSLQRWLDKSGCQ